jgi:hypothetical protein
MSTDPYPEAKMDETGHAQHQGGRTAEWPKKIRTLTAAELDRLTIDSAGRFYWDGRLVNYEPPLGHGPEPKPGELAEQSALEIIDRAVHDIEAHRAPESIEGAELHRAVAAPIHQDIAPAVELETTRHEETEPQFAAAAVVPPFVASDRLRLSLSFWQSLGALIVVLGIAVGASGIAAYGLVAAHDWTCRIGLVKRYCPPPPPPPRQPTRPDIPA